MKAVIYTIPGCLYCKAAKEDLAQRAVEFVEYDVQADKERFDEMVRISGSTMVPVVVEEGVVTVGFGGGCVV